MRIFAELPEAAIGGIVIASLLVLFGIIIAVVIYVKKHNKPLGIDENEKVDEEAAAQQELDRILVPIEDDELIEAQAEQEEIKKDE